MNKTSGENISSKNCLADYFLSLYYCIKKLVTMTTQSEAALENGLIKTLIDNSYERVIIKEEENLKTNFKVQLEKHNQKELQLHGRSQFTDKEFEKILIYLEGGTRFEKAKKLRDLYPLETEDGERIWVSFSIKKSGVRTSFRLPTR